MLYGKGGDLRERSFLGPARLCLRISASGCVQIDLTWHHLCEEAVAQNVQKHNNKQFKEWG